MAAFESRIRAPTPSPNFQVSYSQFQKSKHPVTQIGLLHTFIPARDMETFQPMEFRTGCFVQCEVDGRVNQGDWLVHGENGHLAPASVFRNRTVVAFAQETRQTASGKMRVYIP
jgi:hypothetical protein